MDEIWKTIFGFEKKYLISNTGRIKTLGRYSHSVYSKRWIEEKIKNQNTDKDGYKYINLSLGYKKLCKRVHRLVAIHFIPNHENKPCVNHKNGNKSDNTIKNLEWSTYSENNTHAFRVLKRVHPKGFLGKKWTKLAILKRNNNIKNK